MGVHYIDAVEDRSYDPNAEYFKVRTPEGKRYILRSDRETGEWTLQSGFDGAELLARPGIELVTVDPTTIRKADSKIAGCERCRNYELDIPFSFVIADVLEKHGAFDFILSEAGHCPNCNGELTEKTLVEPQGGIEVKQHQGRSEFRKRTESAVWEAEGRAAICMMRRTSQGDACSRRLETLPLALLLDPLEISRKPIRCEPRVSFRCL